MAFINGKEVLFSVHLHTGSGIDESILNAFDALFDVPIYVGEGSGESESPI